MERTLEVAGVSLRVVERGPADAPAVLLVHGLGGWAENWSPTIDALAAAGFRAIAFDLPGCGQSALCAEADYFRGASALYPRLPAQILDALGIERAHVIGHSLGGAIAYLGTVTAPERVITLTLVAPGGIGLDLPWPLRLGSIPFIGGLVRGRSREAALAGLASCFHQPSRMPEWLIEQSGRYSSRSVPEALRVLRAGVTWRGVRPELQREWIAKAPAFTGRVLVVWGRHDRVLPFGHAAAAQQLFPRSELSAIDDAGHLVMVEQPEAFMSALLPFITKEEAVPSYQ